MSWKERFASKIVTAAQAADRIRDNSLIRFPMGVPPPTLLGELIARRGKVHGLTVNQGIPALPYPFAGDASWRDSIRLQTDFISPPIRGAVNSNIVDFLVTEYSLGSKVTEGEGRQNNWNCDV